jgi:hypothetical protein
MPDYNLGHDEKRRLFSFSFVAKAHVYSREGGNPWFDRLTMT